MLNWVGDWESGGGIWEPRGGIWELGGGIWELRGGIRELRGGIREKVTPLSTPTGINVSYRRMFFPVILS